VSLQLFHMSSQK